MLKRISIYKIMTGQVFLDMLEENGKKLQTVMNIIMEHNEVD